MLSTSQAEGYSQQTYDGSILEDYLDSIVVMPVEMRRYLTLLLDLDSRAREDLETLQQLQAEYVEKVRVHFEGKEPALMAPDAKAGELAKVDPDLKKRIDQLRGRYHQKLDEKESIAVQLYDTSEINLKRLDHDVQRFKVILTKSGDYSPKNFMNVGDIVAACTHMNQGVDPTWILGRVSSYSPLSPDRCVIADVDNAATKYSLKTSRIVILPTDEDVSGARARLPGKGKRVMAMYPDTTSFYKATLVMIPYKATRAEGEALMNQVVCAIQFFDDEDYTGNIPKRILLAKYVFKKD